jgi:Lon protease-like protein
MAEGIVIDFSMAVPLFPLPSCILLPHATIPLHIFEPRYRQMLADALAGPRLLAMAIFDGEDWKEDYLGLPPLRRHVCVGYVVRHDPLTDGGSNILLQGVCRARIEEEIPGEPYRRALLEPTESASVMEIDLQGEREELESLLNDPQLVQLAAVNALRSWMSGETPTVALVDLAGMLLADDVEQRYRMLAEADPAARLRSIIGNLRQTRRTLAIAGRYEPTETDNGVHLN